jgi:hypothetical protein
MGRVQGSAEATRSLGQLFGKCNSEQGMSLLVLFQHGQGMRACIAGKEADEQAISLIFVFDSDLKKNNLSPTALFSVMHRPKKDSSTKAVIKLDSPYKYEKNRCNPCPHRASGILKLLVT